MLENHALVPCDFCHDEYEINSLSLSDRGQFICPYCLYGHVEKTYTLPEKEAS